MRGDRPSGGGIRQAGRRWQAPSRLPGKPRYARTVDQETRFGRYAALHFGRKRAAAEGCPRWLASVRRHLVVAVSHFGAATPLRSIRAPDVEDYVEHLLQQPNGRGGLLSATTVNHYLDSLQNLFRRAERDGLVSRNPVRQLLSRPRTQPSHTPWLEVPEVRAILDRARLYVPGRPDLAIPFLFELVALFAYTGLRREEGLGLQRSEINLERGVLLVRPNRWRGLKTRESERAVPLFPELRVILRSYLSIPHAPAGDLLFPSPATAEERPLTNLRRSVGRQPLPQRLTNEEDVRLGPQILRHSYCAARLQTLDAGHPISPYTVAREMGHTDLKMVLRIYAHLGEIRCRGDAVRYSRRGGEPHDRA